MGKKISNAVFLLFVVQAFTACTTNLDSVGLAKERNRASLIPMSNQAAEFLVDAVDARRMEIQAAQIAAKRATTPELRDYAAATVQVQEQVLRDLEKLAWRNNIKVPARLGKTNSEKIQELSQMQGENFDKAFLVTMNIDHDYDVDEFKKARHFEDGDRAARLFADEYLPVMERELDQIKNVRTSYSKWTTAGSNAMAW